MLGLRLLSTKVSWSAVQNGVYKHFVGDEKCQVIGSGFVKLYNSRIYVVHRDISNPDPRGALDITPISWFCAKVDHEGKLVPRWELVEKHD